MHTSSAFLLKLESLDVCASGRRPLLNAIAFTLSAGERLAVIGPNGCGKSTLLKTLIGERRPASGKIWLAGQPLSAFSRHQRAQRIAYLAQHDEADPGLRVEDYVALGRLPHHGHTTAAQDSAISLAAIADVGLGRQTHARIGTLSGGERQRAALARALAQTPQLLLLDEPTNHLDPLARQRLLMLVRRKGIATIAVLHDLPLVSPFADRVLVLRSGQMLICAPPDVALAPHIVMATFGLESYTLPHPLTGQPVRFFAAPSGA